MASQLATGNHNKRCEYCGNYVKNADYTVCRSCGKPNMFYDPQRRKAQ